MRINWFYILVAVMFLGMLVLTNRFFRGSGHASVGIAQSTEYRISADKAALVRAVAVVPGQQVKKGQLLVELSSNELEINIEKLSYRIQQLRAELADKGKLASSEVALVRAEGGISVEEINSDLEETESEMRLNRKLSESLALVVDTVGDDPVKSRLQALRMQKEKHQQAVNIRVSDILQESSSEQRVLENQISVLERELVVLQEEKKKLNKYAAGPGVIEKIFVKEDEQIDAFTPLLSVNPIHPAMVTAYLVGRKAPLPVGADVGVSSYERPHEVFPGKVIGYGAVVALPDILQKATAVKAFGREVFIELTADNTFASGEKVLIK